MYETAQTSKYNKPTERTAPHRYFHPAEFLWLPKWKRQRLKCPSPDSPPSMRKRLRSAKLPQHMHDTAIVQHRFKNRAGNQHKYKVKYLMLGIHTENCMGKCPQGNVVYTGFRQKIENHAKCEKDTHRNAQRPNPSRRHGLLSAASHGLWHLQEPLRHKNRNTKPHNFSQNHGYQNKIVRTI